MGVTDFAPIVKKSQWLTQKILEWLLAQRDFAWTGLTTCAMLATHDSHARQKKDSILHTHSLCCICHIATCLSLPVCSLSPCVIFPQPVFSLLMSVFSFPSPCGFFPSFLCHLPSPLFLLLSLCFSFFFPIFLPSLCNFPTLPVSSSPSLCAVEVPASAIRRRGRQVVRMGSSFSQDQTIFWWCAGNDLRTR